MPSGCVLAVTVWFSRSTSSISAWWKRRRREDPSRRAEDRGRGEPSDQELREKPVIEEEVLPVEDGHAHLALAHERAERPRYAEGGEPAAEHQHVGTRSSATPRLPLPVPKMEMELHRFYTRARRAVNRAR